MKPKRAALYLRVSTGEQTTANQAKALKAVAVHRGWSIVQTYEDAGIWRQRPRQAPRSRCRTEGR
jgi:DNA invertase Pin-like site-specific DNA recombinase